MKYQNVNTARTARAGVYTVGKIVEEELGWIFREQMIEDYGIDAHLEMCIDGLPTGQLVAAQIKSGSGYFERFDEEGYIFYGEKKHLDYWVKHSLPVILILYNPIESRAWWTPIDSKRVVLTEKNWKIKIPYESMLNDSAIGTLTDYYSPEVRKIKDINEILGGNDISSIELGHFLQMLHRAEECIDITFPFVDEAMFWVIKSLSHKVRIRLITSGFVTEEVMREAFNLNIESPNFEIKVYRNQNGNGIIHEKSLIIDGIFLLYGSINLTKNSLRNSSEVIKTTSEVKNIERVRLRFDELWTNNFVDGCIVDLKDFGTSNNIK